MLLTGYEKDMRSCELCEHRCGVDRLAGELGVCRMGGPAVASRTLHPAPPESYTIFLAGCNLKCLNCQNWSISQYPENGMPVNGYVDPDALAQEAVGALDSRPGRLMGVDRIFWSGGEPTIHLPYVEEVVAKARRLNPAVRVNLDTNGFMTEPSLRRILRFATSITFDIKAYEADNHRALTGTSVGPVLRNAEILAREAPGTIWELRVLVIPEVNEDDIQPLCSFLAGIKPDLPVCFLAFRPNYLLDAHPGASRDLMEKCVESARETGLSRATWAGVTGIRGLARPYGPGTEDVPGNRAMPAWGSYASSRGCKTSPRDCKHCTGNSDCPLKRYIPKRQT